MWGKCMTVAECKDGDIVRIMERHGPRFYVLTGEYTKDRRRVVGCIALDDAACCSSAVYGTLVCTVIYNILEDK